MKVLVAGATGQLGSGLLEVAGEAGSKVIALSRRPSKGRRRLEQVAGADKTLDGLLGGDVAQPYWGLGEAELEGLVSEVDAVVNLAAETNWTASARELQRTNVIGAVRGLQLSRRLAGQSGRECAYVYASSIHSAGEMVGPIAERPFGPDPGRTPYEQSKWLAEQELLSRSAEGDGAPLLVARIGGLVGSSRTGQTAKQNSLYLLSAAWGRLPARLLPYNPRGRVDMLPRDVAASMLLEITRRLVERPAGGPEIAHVCAGESAPTAESLFAVLRASGAPGTEAAPRTVAGPPRVLLWSLDAFQRLHPMTPEWRNAFTGLRYLTFDRVFERSRLAGLLGRRPDCVSVEELVRVVFGDSRQVAAPVETSLLDRDVSMARFAE